MKTAEQQLHEDEGQGARGAEARLPPEFLNRIDSQVVFHSLSKADIRKIVDLQLRDAREAAAAEGRHRWRVTDAAKDWLGEKGYDQVFGARPLRRVIQNELEDRLSEMLLSGSFGSGDKVVVDYDGESGLSISTELVLEPSTVS